MKLATVLSILALGLFATVAEAAQKLIFEEINETAPLSDAFEDLRQAAPRSVFDSLNESAPRSDGVYGDLEKIAP